MFNRFDFEAATPEALADRLGELSARADSIAKEIAATKAAILETGVKTADGKRYTFNVVAGGERESFKPAKAKAFLSARQIAECTEMVAYKDSVRIKARG